MNAIKSKVKSVQQSGIYKNSNGVDVGGGVIGFYTHEYQFENNVVLKANHKVQEPFKEGDNVEYTVKGTNEYGSYGSVSKPKEEFQNVNNSFKNKSSNSSFALSYAKDWCLGLHHAGEPKTPNDVLAVADAFKQWLDQNQ